MHAECLFVRWGRRMGAGGATGDRVNLFARFGQTVLFAGQAFDGGGIGLQGAILKIQLLVLSFDSLDFLLQRLQFFSLPARRHESVLAENIVDDEGDADQQQRQDAVAIKRRRVEVQFFHGSASAARKVNDELTSSHGAAAPPANPIRPRRTGKRELLLLLPSLYLLCQVPGNNGVSQFDVEAAEFILIDFGHHPLGCRRTGELANPSSG